MCNSFIGKLRTARREPWIGIDLRLFLLYLDTWKGRIFNTYKRNLRGNEPIYE